MIEAPLELPQAYVDEEYTIPFNADKKLLPNSFSSYLTDPQGRYIGLNYKNNYLITITN
jgi:hypothetical protein